MDAWISGSKAGDPLDSPDWLFPRHFLGFSLTRAAANNLGQFKTLSLPDSSNLVIINEF